MGRMGQRGGGQLAASGGKRGVGSSCWEGLSAVVAQPGELSRARVDPTDPGGPVTASPSPLPAPGLGCAGPASWFLLVRRLLRSCGAWGQGWGCAWGPSLHSRCPLGTSFLRRWPRAGLAFAPFVLTSVEKGAGRQGGTHGAPPCGMGGLEKEGGACHGEGQGPPRRPHGARVGEWWSPGGAPSPPGGTGRWPGCG